MSEVETLQLHAPGGGTGGGGVTVVDHFGSSNGYHLGPQPA